MAVEQIEAEQTSRKSDSLSIPETGTQIVPRRLVACPYLGLLQDPTVTAIVPTVQHACYAGKRRQSPSVEHQAIFCFRPVYSQCEYYRKHSESDVDSVYGLVDGEGRRRTANWIPWVGTGLAAILAVVGLFLFASGAITFGESSGSDSGSPNARSPAPAGIVQDSHVVALGAGTATPTPEVATSPSPSSGLLATGSEEDVELARLVPTQASLQATSTVGPSGQRLEISPRQEDVGWWVSGETRQAYIGDSFLYSGTGADNAFVSAVWFDLRRIPRGAQILEGSIRLTGSRDVLPGQAVNGQGSDTSWLAQLIAESDLSELAGSDFLTVFGAPASITLSPQLTSADVGSGVVNEWRLDEGARSWLHQQIMDGATSVALRIVPFGLGDEMLFAWDSGHGSESNGEGPLLILDTGPPPPTPPPTPTRPVLIATLTPEPENVLTVVARSAPANALALESGTASPTQLFVITPTPLPENLATVQAAALAEGLPAVVLHTPLPSNAATAAAISQYATAVALTTGTFTPVPTGYVTPAMYYPPPPPENVATAAARSLRATAAAASHAPTATWPWNAVAAEYVYATETPENRETLIANIQEQNSNALTTGTPTPTPFNLVVITRVPQPTPTPIPLVVPASAITSTPTPTPTRQITRSDIEDFRNRILFLSDRSEDGSVWAMDPDTGDVVALVTDERLHEEARELFLPSSSDGRQRVFVQADADGDLQIKVEEFEYGTVREITHYPEATSYDPAWSPTGDSIAFVSTESGGDEIYVVSPEGGEPTRLTFNSWEWDKHPSWSPDGSQIVFFSNRETGRRQIWIMDADGSNPRNLSNNEFNDWDPVWIR